MVRSRRKLFLHKGAFHKYKGYAYSQMHKIRTKKPVASRKAEYDKHGYDLKFAYHTVRLMNQAEQILIEGDLDLERNRQQLKDIRKGYWSLEQVEKYFEEKERSLEAVYASSTLQHKPDQEVIKRLLLNCLEITYGSLDNVVRAIDSGEGKALLEVRDVLRRYGVMG